MNKPNQRSCRIALFAAALLTAISSAYAQTGSGWTGGTSTNFQTSSNWDNGFGNNFNLFIGNTWNSNGRTGNTTLNNASAYSGYRITFESGASTQTFTLQGSTITLFDFGGNVPKLENNATANQNINAPITFGSGDHGELNAVNGNLTFGGTVTATAVNGIRLYGSSQTVNFNGTVTATGKYIGISTAGTGNTININGSLTASDFSVMNNGVLNLNSGGSLNSAVRLGGDYTGSGNLNTGQGASFNLTKSDGNQTFSGVVNSVSGNTSGTLVVNSQNSSNTNTLSGHLALDAALKITQSAGGTLSITQAKGADTTTGTDIKGQTLTLTPAAGGTINHSGTIYNSTGSGSVAVNGSGSTTLSGANTYSGTTSVTAGTLLVSNTSGSGTGTSTVTVNGSGTVLGGTGTITGTVGVGNVTPGAIINPGNSGTAGTSAAVGTLTTGALTLTGADVFHVDASGTLTSNWDKLVANGVTLGTTSTLQLSIASGLHFASGSPYTLIDNTSAGAISGTFAGISQGGIYSLSGYDFMASYTGGTGNDFTLTAVPEPSTWAAGILSLAGLGLMQRRRFAQLLKRP